MIQKKKILVIAAHPDDEILGVGGTLLRHKKNNDEIYICMVTSAYLPNWSEEYIQQQGIYQKQVDEILGTTKRFNLDFPTVRLNTIPHGEFNKAIDDVIKTVNPDIVYTHFEHDMNMDHRIVFNACMVACRPPRHIKLVCFETLSETEWNNKGFIPNYWVDISSEIDKKTELFNVYKSEIKHNPHPRNNNGIRVLAMKRGNDICINFAEAFIVIKEYWL